MAGTLTLERHFNFRLFLDDFIERPELQSPTALASHPAPDSTLSTKAQSRQSSETMADSDSEIPSDAERIAEDLIAPKKKSVFSLANFAPKRSLSLLSDVASLASFRLGALQLTAADLSEAVGDNPAQTLRRKLLQMVEDTREFSLD